MPQARKQFGQHWLKSEAALAQIVEAAQLLPSDRVLEIGPGTGILTRRLLPLVEALVGVEIDRDLCEILRKHLSKAQNFLLLEGDFLTMDLAASLAEFPDFQEINKVVANIPYNITGPILEKLLGSITQPHPAPCQSIVLLLQKEVAERISAQPSSKSFGALSVRVQYLADCDWICDVPARAFQPPPKVDSAVVRLRPRPIPTPADDPHQLETLIKLGFATRRKMLRNNLQSVMEREPMAELLESLGLNPQARAEDLGLRDWVRLSNQIQPGTAHQIGL
ncbi:MAG: 16S rRNA (adenine(1518)-N(6)/adenine(1519)-N(6))-dimethyltransferase RsmA [Pegethrix bostrychoides GSE-TBD4-15B]|jgi:16S rRNA (adenine1518-N6/adenine1519-N6)-dimethyltransferase|uniref:Ribosomal RNA small subunit methyltransferase A n=1 Tax=Pegethrix bostrychoides GSE-TBD4-15B TaxID=2839662 RepID=A0A951U4I6_9CYAN|nr:16S rRNA (adenine(1518)-N(6)/adenine(1519)-N(6))-dimethyltransferase RsmA [Pegethrix bostrychoides GSE-TBD4-15B]